jgi:natural product biosynthesis luciferase-like monooxygenase protein
MIALLEAKLSQVLGLRGAAALDPELELSHYGVNSINAAKFSHALSQAFGQEISPRAIIEHFSLAALARHLVNDRGLDARSETSPRAASAVPVQAAAQPGPSKEQLVEKILLELQRRARQGAVAEAVPQSPPAPAAREVVPQPPPAPAAREVRSAQQARASASLDFSFIFFSSQRRVASANIYDYVTGIARHADANGFKAIWVPERHFFEFGGIFPDPGILLANLAATTSSIRLRAGSVVLPLHHATRVAESWSMLDNLSGGRVDLAFASGWNPNDFVSSRDTYPTLRETWFERMSQVERLWRGEHVEFYNGKGELTPIKVYPRPVQEHLAIWMAISGNPESFVEAGRRGYNVLTMLASKPVEELQANIARYRQARAEHGFDPDAGIVTLMLHTYVHEDVGRVDACVNEHYFEYIKSGLRGHLQAMSPKPSEDEVRRIVEHSFHYQRKHSALFGDVAHCRAVADRMRQIGVNEIACLVDFGLGEAEMYETLPYITQLKDAANGITTAPVVSPTVSRTPPAPLPVPGAAPARAEYAIVGMAGTYPGAKTLEGFWDNLIAGRNCVSEIGPDRYDWRATWGDPRTEPGKTNIRHFGLIDDIYRFDASFFQISKREAELMDPHARLVLQTVWQCIENAGYAPPALSQSRTGLFLSFYNPEYLYVLDAAEIEKSSEPYLGTALSGALKANRISHLLGLKGPSEVYDTACSSALVALHRAMQSIAAGDCVQALVGGVSLLLTPRRVIALSKLGILNTTGVCNPFSYPPNKEVIGEGVGALLIKPLADALAANDYIYAVVSGSDVSHQGNSSGSLTMPSAGALAELMDTTYRKLGLGLEQVSYIEGHGSGNDSDLVELLAFQHSFAPVRDRHTVWVGSVKSNIGFGEGSGGMAQLTKCALALDRGVVPATIHFEQADPAIDLASSGLAIPTMNRELLPRDGERHYMSVLAYGLGGTNGHIVLRDHAAMPRRDRHAAMPGAPYPMLFSAGSEAGLSAYLGDVHLHLRQDRVRRNYERWCGSPDAVLHAISRTLMARERHGAHRVALLVSSYDELLAALAGGPSAGSIGGPIARHPELARWVDGAGWPAVQADPPYQRLALPPPPFAGAELRLKQKATSERPQADLAQRMQWSRTEAGTRVSIEIFAEDYFVREHVVDGMPIVPAAAYLVLLSRIAHSVFGLERCVVKNIAWLKPFALAGTASASMQFEVDASGQFRVLERASGAVCCKGQLLLDERSEASPVGARLVTAALDDTALLLDADAYWKLLNGPQSKQRHGATFRCVDGLYRQDAACVARLRAGSRSALLPEIALYDAALGAGIGTAVIHRESPAPAVPFSIETFTFLAALPGSGPVYAVASRREGKLPRYDISLEDGSGRVYAVISGFYARPFEALAPVAPGGEDSPRPAARPARPAAAPGPSGGRSRDALLDTFRTTIAAFLKLAVEDVPTDEGLGALGLDSIAVNEVTGQLSQELAIDLPATLMFEYTRIDEMVEHVLEVHAAELGAVSAGPSSPPSPAAEPAISHHDAGLPRRAPAADLRIAVVGIGGVFPGAANVQDFWAKIKAGRDLIVEMPAGRRALVDRLFASRFPGLERLFGGFVEDAERFDAEFFGFSDEEVLAMDPQQRLFLVAAWQAVEDAGYYPRSLSGRHIGVYAGAIANEYAHLLSAAGVSSQFIGTGNALSGIANRVSYVLDLNGPSQTIDVACCSSLYAIDRAVQDLRAGVCEAALVGGVSFIGTPVGFQSYAAMSYLARDWRCKTFADGGDGWSKGEMFAAVYLKPLPQAVADHDAIYAVIAASGTNHGGKSHFYEQPNSTKHLELITRVYREAGLDPRDLVHIEAHGTGTEMGDALEYNVFVRALHTLGKERGVSVDAGSCGVGSIKSNMGHAEAASGIAGFIKSVLLLHDKVIPPSLHLGTPNKHLRLNESPLYLASEPAAFPQRGHHGQGRHAGVHSFNFSGAAAHVLLGEAPAMLLPSGSLGVTRYPVCVSAPALEGLAACVRELIGYLDSGVPASLDALIYTLNRSRSHFTHRLALTAGTLEELRAQLVTASRALAQGAPGSGEVGDGIRYRQVDAKSAQKVRDYAALSDATVPALLDQWLSASRFDWSVVLAPFALTKQHLPAYSFLRERSYLPQVAAQAVVAAPHVVVAAPPAVVAAEGSPVPASAPRGSPDAGAEDIAGCVQAVLGQLSGVPRQDVELDGSLAAFALDSLKFEQLAARLNDRYSLRTTAADYFMWGSPAEIVAFVGEQLARRPVAARVTQVAESPVAAPSVAAPVTPLSVAPAREATPEPIAIVGVSGAFPGAPDVASFWQALATGRDCIREIPEDRWDWRAIYGDPTREGDKTNIKWGGFLDGAGEFDPLFFNISPHEAQLMDPQQRLLMMHTWKAIEDAGYSPDVLSGTRTGIFVGTTSSGYGELLVHANQSIDAYSSTGAVASLGPNRMSYLLNLHGPSEPIETACSSSLVALHRAVRAMQSGDCEMALVGGVNTIVSPWGHIGFSRAGMLCEDGRCKTFSKHANGYVRGEGVGMLFLKKLSAAERDGDHIYALVRSSAENHGGRASSLTAPNPRAQAELVKSAYREAGIDPRTVSYIETHGTGTALGDPIEINGLKKAFAELAGDAHPEGTGSPAHCGLGSVKTNVGHLEMAAGVAGVIKVLLQLQHRTLVKSLHCDEINPYIQLDGSPFYIVREAQPWHAQHDRAGRSSPRRAGVSSFGFGGVNAHVVLEEYCPPDAPRPAHSAVAPERPALIVLSARTEDRLQDQAGQLLAWLSAPGREDHELFDIAYTLQVGRQAMEHRLAFTAATLDAARDQLAQRDRCYRGEVKKYREVLSIFNGDDVLQAAISAWLREGKHTKLLELWVKGVAVDWERLYGPGSAYGARRPRRVALPTYPFARERYWAHGHGKRGDEQVRIVGRGQSARGSDAGAFEALLDELAGQRISVDAALDRVSAPTID